MTASPIVARTELARLLAGFLSIRQLDQVLREGRFPVDDRSRAIIDKGLRSIQQEHAQWDTPRQQPDQAKVFADFAVLLQRTFQSDAGRRAIAVMKEEAVWRPPIHIGDKQLAELHEASVFYSQIYQKPHKHVRQTEPDNWLFYRLYRLYEEIKGSHPGIGGPLYRFTAESTKLLGIKFHLTPTTFYVRMRRLLTKQQMGFGSLAAIASLPFEQDANRPIMFTSELGSLGSVL